MRDLRFLLMWVFVHLSGLLRGSHLLREDLRC